MEESMLDVIENMERVVPEYSYSSVAAIVQTDEKVRDFLLEKMKEIKDYLFHVVQISYELQRDKLSEAAESVWNDVKILMNRIENSKTASLKGDKNYCVECKDRIEKNIQSLVRRDRELVMSSKDMRRTAHLLYKELIEKGRERHFIKGVDGIKKYVGEMDSLLDKRERIITGE